MELLEIREGLTLPRNSLAPQYGDPDARFLANGDRELGEHVNAGAIQELQIGQIEDDLLGFCGEGLVK
jgi:hypothetical protein